LNIASCTDCFPCNILLFFYFDFQNEGLLSNKTFNRYQFGNGQDIASGTIGQSCFITNAGVGQNCDALTSAIQTCKNNGVKIILSLGGASSSWALASQSEAETIAQNLWDAYGNVAGGSVPRPFGSTFVDGFDFDLESNQGNQYFQVSFETPSSLPLFGILTHLIVHDCQIAVELCN